MQVEHTAHDPNRAVGRFHVWVPPVIRLIQTAVADSASATHTEPAQPILMSGIVIRFSYDWCYEKKALRRQGGNRQSVPNRKEQSMELGAFSISLTVKDIEASRSFYEKFGFTVFGGDAAQN